MGFKGHKYKFTINSSHSLSSTNEKTNIHFHTFEITLFIEHRSENFMLYENVEEDIYKYLSRYSNVYINEISPFDRIEPSIENMGYEFYSNIKEILNKKQLDLFKLEISEVPTRIFIVRDAEMELSSLEPGKRKKLNFLLSEIEEINKERQNTKSKRNPKNNNARTYKNELINEKSIVKNELKEEEITETLESDIVDENKGNNRLHNIIKIFASLSFIIISAFLTVVYVKKTGIYPTGFDVYGHLFKSNLLYESIKQGNLYPLYTSLWYNGVQPFRYWAPIPYYLLALLEFIANGDVMNSYLLFIGISFTIGAIGWLKFGIENNKILLCTFFGILWFFMPDNARIFFSEGNIPRMVIAMLLPYLFYHVVEFIGKNKRKHIIPIIIYMSLIILCHVMVAAMVGITTFIFAFIYSILNKKYKESTFTIIGMLLAFALVGVWLYPALQGGLMSMNASSTAEVMASLNTKAIISLNPFIRLKGTVDVFYYGLSIMVISVLGVLVSNKRSIPGFVTTILIFFGTTTALVPIIAVLPLNQLLWMIRFTPIAYTLFLISIIEWRKCKKLFICIFCILLILDAIPTFNLEKHASRMSVDVRNSTQQQIAEKYLLYQAKKTTTQRLSIYDTSRFGSFPSYYIGNDTKTPYSYGWAWQGASTANNIVMLNTALEKEYFNYLFDRSIEMGDDTVIVSKDIFADKERVSSELKYSASLLGFKFVEEGEHSYVFHMDTPKNFGVISDYTGISIGSSANLVTLQFPSFEEGKSKNINDYTFDELQKYKRIYLSGFEYKDKTKAEELIRKLTQSGVKVYIDMNRIPVNALTNHMEILGVTAQNIKFTDQYPELIYNNKTIKSGRFKEEYSSWNTVYLENLKNVNGYVNFDNKKLSFLGSGENENMIFIGFNLLYHVTEAKDAQVTNLLNQIFQVDEDTLAKRQIVPIKVSYNENKIIIDSSMDNVNTTIAFQDNFKSNQEIKKNNNLLVVNKGETEINIEYPYLMKGIIVTFIGIIGIGILIYVIYNESKILH